jgi:hypothetical protein
MFVYSKNETETVEAKANALTKLVGVCAWAGISLLAVWGSASHAIEPAAEDSTAWYQPGTIPVAVTLTDVSPVSAIAEDMIYVSIQTRETYRSLKGHGGILRTLTPGTMQATFHVAEPGEYAVSVWHDRDNDMRFSMDEKYNILDGWGASGTPPTDRMPGFDDVKITVPNMGTSVTVDMINPS